MYLLYFDFRTRLAEHPHLVPRLCLPNCGLNDVFGRQSLGCATNSNLKFFELVKFGGFRSIVGLLVGISSLEQWNASTEHIRV